MSRKKTTQEFIEQSLTLYPPNSYDYSLTTYIKNNVKVIIVCKIHNITFLQTPSNHLTGFSGCSECKFSKMSKLFRRTIEKFISKANKKFAGFYTYEKVVFSSKHIKNSKIIITCPLHGDFRMIPSQHLAGHACRQCSIENHPGGIFSLSYFEKHPEKVLKPAILYHVKFLCNVDQSTFFKVGITTTTLEERFAAPVYSEAFALQEILWTVIGTLKDIFLMERALKKDYLAHKVKIDRKVYPKFHGGSTECFSVEIPVPVSSL